MGLPGDLDMFPARGLLRLVFMLLLLLVLPASGEMPILVMIEIKCLLLFSKTDPHLGVMLFVPSLLAKFLFNLGELRTASTVLATASLRDLDNDRSR